MKRLCLDCNLPLHGRLDKKFCGDACRGNYHNRVKSEDQQYIRRVNAILRKNRNLLLEFNPDGTRRMKMKILQAQGFNFDYTTTIYRNVKGDTYYFCYDYGYLPLPPEDVLLVKKKEK